MILLACNAQQNGGASSSSANIIIDVKGVSTGTAYLIGTSASRRFRLDSAIVDGTGRLVFQKEKPYPHGYYVAYYTDGTALQFLLDGDQELTLSTEKADLVSNMQVEGSLTNELLYQNLRFESEMQPKFTEVNGRLSGLTAGTPEHAAVKAEQDQLVIQRKAHLNDIFTSHPNNFFTKFKQAGQNPDLRTELIRPDGTPDNEAQVYYFRREFWDNVDFADSNLLRTPVIANKLERYMTQLTPQRADSVISSANFLLKKVINHPPYLRYFANWITLKYEPGKTTLMDGEAVYVNMIRNYFTKDLAFWSDSMTVYGLQQRAGEMAQSLMGQEAPNITVNDLNGQARKLYDEKAPYVIVFMYNPTCEHCIEETPKLLNFVRGRSDVNVYAIAIDTEEGPWKKFVQQFGTQSWTNVYDPSNRSIYKTYYVDHTPELYLLNPDRVIIGKNLKTSQIAEVIQRDREG